MLAHRRAVAEVVVGMDEEVEQPLLVARTPYLAQLERAMALDRRIGAAFAAARRGS